MAKSLEKKFAFNSHLLRNDLGHHQNLKSGNQTYFNASDKVLYKKTSKGVKRPNINRIMDGPQNVY
jgi:hypothetical protein